MPAIQLYSSQQQQPCSYANNMVGRSKPIAIQNQHLALEEAQLEREQEAQERQFYEGTTWRMYNRIVHHRLNTPPQPRLLFTTAVMAGKVHRALTPVGSPTVQLVRPKPRYARAHAPMIPSFPPAPMYNNEPVFDMEGLEDEVFDFEL